MRKSYSYRKTLEALLGWGMIRYLEPEKIKHCIISYRFPKQLQQMSSFSPLFNLGWGDLNV
jgi:hypothetical protein